MYGNFKLTPWAQKISNKRGEAMMEIFRAMIEYFNNKVDYINVFDRNDVRVEGWFKGELLVFFDRLKKQGIIQDYSREKLIRVGETRRQIDFEIKSKDIANLIEIKAMPIAKKKGTPRDLGFYFTENNNGILNDFTKLESINMQNANKWIICFINPKPAKKEWEEKIKVINKGWTLRTNLEEFQDDYYVAIWENA